MALRVWLPLNGNLNNQGLSNLTFTNSNSSTITIDASGKIGSCYQRATKQTAGYITSNQKYDFNNDITICTWAYVMDCVSSANGLVTIHDHNSSTNIGITAKYISATDFRICCNTGNGNSRTFDAYYGTTNIKNKWCHLAVTYKKSNQQLLLYVNGVVEYTLNNYYDTYDYSKYDSYVNDFNLFRNHNNLNNRFLYKY